MSTVKIGKTIAVPEVNAKNINSPEAWKLAQSAVSASGASNGLVHFYAYGLYATSVILGTKQVEIANSSGAQTAQITKARKVLEHFVAQVINEDESGEKIVSVETCAEALELAVSEYGALGTAHADLFPKETTEVSLAKAVASAVKKAIELGVSVDELLALVATEFVHQSAE